MTTEPHLPTTCSILPPYLLERLAANPDPRIAGPAQRSLALDEHLRARREEADRLGEPSPGIVPPPLRDRLDAWRQGQSAPPSGAQAGDGDDLDEPPTARRTIYSADGGTTLPGRLVRAEGQDASGDPTVEQAYDGLGATWELLLTEYARDSLDGRGLPLVATVHYGQKYDNAFWDGTQMVFGDGDGELFGSFTSSIDIMGHELAHGLTQYTAALVYLGQSGALNESISDVFGSLVKQRHLGHDAAAADWLIGAGLFTAAVNGVALRSMKEPGTAYDDPVLGKDPQPADMDGYVQLPNDRAHDNGGVHINSGIPNRAFYLVASALGGPAWPVAGQIWFDTITSGGLPRDADFVTFAQATAAAAAARYGAASPEVAAVDTAWATVKVLPSGTR